MEHRFQAIVYLSKTAAREYYAIERTPSYVTIGLSINVDPASPPLTIMNTPGAVMITMNYAYNHRRLQKVNSPRQAFDFGNVNVNILPSPFTSDSMTYEEAFHAVRGAWEWTADRRWGRGFKASVVRGRTPERQGVSVGGVVFVPVAGEEGVEAL
ncbi:uncharacterized protein KY384_002337 [Bacidia gigantensis]|uniref:uncharacterized protein n=1 Tax=Bacidia gigantensis TaxID=2732470 RepID=UPI001D05AF81|nr:uncharacterized protein KY384_002337 [Bacidia gigantensis]KAG8532460.1 hypothetical protein KY384_002337 [Bacidia gigantensis]